VIPAPTFALLYLDVGAPEIGAWLAICGAIIFAVALLDARRAVTARFAAAMALLATVRSLSPFVRFRTTAREFATAMAGVSAPPRDPIRRDPLVVADLFRRITPGAMRGQGIARFSVPSEWAPHTNIYYPESDGSYPILVQIYGGAWQRGTPSANADFAMQFASHGWVVFAIDYRHAPAYRWPTQLADVDSALMWVRDNAAKYGGDTSRIVLLGRSSGAQLALLAAYQNPPVRIRGVVSYYGPVDLVDSWRNPPRPDPIGVRSVEQTLIGGPFESAPNRYAEASPLTYVRRELPPTLLVYAGRDHIVEPRYGRQLRDRLLATQTPVAYLEIPWAGHGFDAVFNGPSSQLALYHTERFLAWATR
jgi:acetyl esterase/lipase